MRAKVTGDDRANGNAPVNVAISLKATQERHEGAQHTRANGDGQRVQDQRHYGQHGPKNHIPRLSGADPGSADLTVRIPTTTTARRMIPAAISRILRVRRRSQKPERITNGVSTTAKSKAPAINATIKALSMGQRATASPIGMMNANGAQRAANEACQDRYPQAGDHYQRIRHRGGNYLAAREEARVIARAAQGIWLCHAVTSFQAADVRTAASARQNCFEAESSVAWMPMGSVSLGSVCPKSTWLSMGKVIRCGVLADEMVEHTGFMSGSVIQLANHKSLYCRQIHPALRDGQAIGQSPAIRSVPS